MPKVFMARLIFNMSGSFIVFLFLQGGGFLSLGEWLDEVYPRLSHEQVFGSLPGFKRVGATNSYVALCPVHTEKTPSFHMGGGQPFGHCFGCGVTISWWKFIEMRGLSGQQIINELAGLAGVPPLVQGDQVKAAKDRAEAEAREEWWQKVKTSLCQPEGADVLSYLLGRGYSQDQIRTMDVGANSDEPPPPGVNLPLAEYRLLIPARVSGGRIVGLAGRRLDSGEPKYLYSKGLEKSSFLWGGYRLRKGDIPVVVEGVLDVEAIAAHGPREVVAIGGTSLSDAQVKILVPHRKVIFALDADESGRRATEETVRKLSAIGVKVYVVPDFSGAKDPDEFVRVNGIAAFAKLVQGAQAGHKWLTERLIPAGPLTDAQRDEVLGKVLKFAENLSRHDPVAAQEAISLAADKLSLDTSALAEALKRLAGKRREERLKRIWREALVEAQKALSSGDVGKTSQIVAQAKEEAAAVAQVPPASLNQAEMEDALQHFPTGLSTPWPNVNRLTRIDAGGLTVVAAGTHHGKSTFAFNLILHYLANYPDGMVILWSGEMAAALIYARLVSILAGREYSATITDFRTGMFPVEVVSARAKLAGWLDRLVIIDSLKQDITTTDQLSVAVKNIVRRQPITAVLVDYLQQLVPPEKPDGSRYGTREQEVTATSKFLHVLGGSLSLPVIAFAQISRNNYQYKERPRLTDLRESGGIEQYAQAVYGLWNSSMAGKRSSAETSSAPPDGWYWFSDDSVEAEQSISMAQSHGGVLLEVGVLKARLRGNIVKAVPLLLLPESGEILSLPVAPGAGIPAPTTTPTVTKPVLIKGKGKKAKR